MFNTTYYYRKKANSYGYYKEYNGREYLIKNKRTKARLQKLIKSLTVTLLRRHNRRIIREDVNYEL